MDLLAALRLDFINTKPLNRLPLWILIWNLLGVLSLTVLPLLPPRCHLHLPPDLPIVRWPHPLFLLLPIALVFAHHCLGQLQRLNRGCKEPGRQAFGQKQLWTAGLTNHALLQSSASSRLSTLWSGLLVLIVLFGWLQLLSFSGWCLPLLRAPSLTPSLPLGKECSSGNPFP